MSSPFLALLIIPVLNSEGFTGVAWSSRYEALLDNSTKNKGSKIFSLNGFVVMH